MLIYSPKYLRLIDLAPMPAREIEARASPLEHPKITATMRDILSGRASGGHAAAPDDGAGAERQRSAGAAGGRRGRCRGDARYSGHRGAEQQQRASRGYALVQ